MSKKSKRVLNGNRKQLHKYVRHMADLIGLRDWTITMGSESPDDPTHGADCDVTYGQKVAKIRFREDWPTMPVEDIRWLAVHELVHVHLWPMEQRMCDLRGVIGVTAYEVTSLAFRDALEHAVDGIARELAEHLPLPVKEKAA